MPWVEELKVQVEVEEVPEFRETLAGLHDTVKPVVGVADAERATLPVKPPRLVRVSVEVPLEPDWKPTVDGLAEIE